MNKFIYQFAICNKVIDNICSKIESGVSYEQIHYKELYDELQKLLPSIPEEFVIYKDRLENILLPKLKLSDIYQTKPYGQQVRIQRQGINPYVFGQIVATRCYIRDTLEKVEKSSLWQTMHNTVIASSKSLFENGHYAESVESAVLELIIRVKRIIKDLTGVSVDGTAAMQKAFAVKNPIIRVADVTTKTGEDIQQGIMEIAAGVVRSIRNPKVHEIVSYTRREAVQKLCMISLLMDTIDQSEIIKIEA